VVKWQNRQIKVQQKCTAYERQRQSLKARQKGQKLADGPNQKWWLYDCLKIT